MNPEIQNEKIKTQWNSLSALPPELVGSTPLGGGGLIEAPYRHYFETRHLKRLVHFHGNMNVLELGCGNGRWIAALAPRVRHYTGVDFSRDGLRLSEQVVRRHRLENVRLVEQSIVEFSGDRPYDLVYFSSVTQYLQDGQIDEVFRRLAPCLHAQTVLVDRSTVSYKERVIHDSDDYYCIYRTPAEIAALFARHGYSNVYRQRTYRYMRGGERLLRGLAGKHLPAVVRGLQPVSMWALLALSWTMDWLRPPHLNGYHEFFVFRRPQIA